MPSQTIDLDPYTTDVPDLVKALKGTVGEVRDLKKQNEAYRQKFDELERRDRQSREQTQRRSLGKRIYSSCDKEFGAQFRNEAVKLADQKVSDGEVDVPRDAIGGYQLMRDCYREVAEKRAPEPQPKPATDTGPRDPQIGGEPEDFAESKSGTLDEVFADIVSETKAGKRSLIALDEF